MIKSSELRELINNYWRFDNAQQPMSSWHEKQDLLELLEEKLRPLPPTELTEEIIVQYGFEKKFDNTGPPINEQIESFALDGYEFMQDQTGAWFLCGYNWNTKHFKYLHELKALYFALSGEELTTKEPAN